MKMIDAMGKIEVATRILKFLDPESNLGVVMDNLPSEVWYKSEW